MYNTRLALMILVCVVVGHGVGGTAWNTDSSRVPWLFWCMSAFSAIPHNHCYALVLHIMTDFLSIHGLNFMSVNYCYEYSYERSAIQEYHACHLCTASYSHSIFLSVLLSICNSLP